MKERDIDQLFGEGLGGSSLPFDESAWISAEEAIIAHEAKKRRRAIVIWLIAGLVLISGALGTYQFISQTSNNSFTEVEKNGQQLQPSNQNNSPVNDNTPEQADSTEPENDESPIGRDKATNSEPADSFRSNFSQPANGIVKEAPVAVILDAEDKTGEPQESIETPNNAFYEVYLNKSAPQALAIRNTNPYPGVESDFSDEDAGRSADIPLPEHWNTRLNLIAGLMPLDYAQRSEQNESNVPYYAGLGISKIRNYYIEYGIALIYEEILLSPNSKRIEQVDYGFTRTTTTHEIQRNRSTYLSIPAYVKYRLRKNHALSFGFQYSRLMQSYSRYSVMESTAGAGPMNLSDQSSISGFNNDLSRNQFSTLLGYNLTLTDRLQFHIQGRFGINSLYKENIRPSDFSERFHLRVGIEYSLWRY